MNLNLNSIKGRDVAMRRAIQAKTFAYPFRYCVLDETKIFPSTYAIRGDIS